MCVYVLNIFPWRILLDIEIWNFPISLKPLTKLLVTIL